MLALAYAAEHSDSASPLVLVGCGTFDRAARARMQAILDDRMDDGTRQRMTRLDEELADPDERLRTKFELIKSLYDYDAVPEEEGRVDLRANQETWADMVRLQEEGVYPAAFAAITSPVLMMHGAHDPHPGRMIRDSLLPHIPQLEYREWERCGHEPWREREVCEEFFALLKEWLAAHLQ
jgi:pimeloyl-ACP methyl ester carboxylesterase